MSVQKVIGIMFTPDRWGTLEWFQHFHASTYTFKRDTQNALSGAANHCRKARLLLRVAREHAVRLSEDQAELAAHGHTSARRGKELSAIVEAIFLDLYSAVDCTRKVVTNIYHNHRGVKQSTRKFFQAAANGTVADSVPQEIRNTFANAIWYDDFRKLRDVITHSDVGSCHADKHTGKIFYMNSGMGTDERAFVKENIFVYIEETMVNVNQFMGLVFHSLNSNLKDDEIRQTCGIFDGRIYTRWVRPSEAIDFNSGRCDAFKWFEEDENPSCPFMQACGAYVRRTHEESI